MKMGSPGAQQLRDFIEKTRIHQERDAFIASIREEQVCNLASSHRRGDRCICFKPPVRGSYNICFFVKFDNGEKWVVRIPLSPCLAFGAKSKLESEIATMLYVSYDDTYILHMLCSVALHSANRLPSFWQVNLRTNEYPHSTHYRLSLG